MTDAQIFQILGITYLAVGIGIIINPDFYKKMITHFTEDAAAIYLGGLAALVIGFLLVSFHNIWVTDWSVIITIIGWAALIKGLFLITLPKTAIKLCNSFKEMKKLMKVWSTVVIILGVLLCWLGFFTV
ncbi:MAG: hypothetical protein CVV39_08400 [Planctomycetes bacterium HGW-Planctomycetes-1]|nr:MAG: hypothetical protein CVV39_08400 [Planctomycetes bacterium HGW-Planctomycetes-1]